jgi:peptidoglycan/xylan/chitin deacetylase (PgdA/CDA1 family)
MKRFTTSLFFIFIFSLFTTTLSHAVIKPGLPKLYLNDAEIISELHIVDKQLYLSGSSFSLLGAKVTDVSADTARIIIGNNELRLDLPSGIASVYQLETSNFLPITYTVINYEKTNNSLWLSVKDLAPFLGYHYARLSDVDLYRLTDGSETITPNVLYEINIIPVAPPRVPATSPKVDDGKTHSANKGDKSPAASKKIVYLTFDDGPNKQTPEILRLLKKYNMKATFFMLNNGINVSPAIVKQINKEGHTMGLHGVTHRKNLFYKDDGSPYKEMDIANGSFKKVMNFQTRLVRTPYGSQPYLSKQQYKLLVDHNYLLWDWNVDSGDSAKSYVAPSIIESRVLTGLKAKTTPVVLLHDKSCTVDALENILIWMSKNGYVSKPLTEDMVPLNWSK